MSPIRDQVKLFCKSHITVGSSIQHLFAAYRRNPKYTDISQFEFELALKALNKTIIKDLVTVGTEFISNIKEDTTFDEAYKAFIAKHQYITRQFWAHLFKDFFYENFPEKKVEKKPESFADQLPLNWLMMTLPERIDFVKKISHEEFKSYVLKQDPDLAKYMKRIKPDSKKMSLYVSLFSFPSDTTSEEAKQLLKSFVDSLNQLGRARLQYMECTDPPVVEIREVRS